MTKKRSADKIKMRYVKVILGIIIVLSLVFFALGVIFQEINYTSKIVIKKPLSEVFKIFNDDSKLMDWIPDITSIKPITQTESEKGSFYEIEVNNNGSKIILEERVLEFIQNERIKLFFKGGGMYKTDDYLFEAASNEVTTLILKTNIKSESFILGCMLPLVSSKLSKQDQEYLNNFKKLVEREND
ncbi:SRPBCC family protein [Tenacibaculum sp. C7A-26P2]|uniref:SRPBCC family protein n=1 Tax=Tenacibaculum sp. C7A-26P2 TaxID=3447504 RepID=UPI003F86990D